MIESSAIYRSILNMGEFIQENKKRGKSILPKTPDFLLLFFIQQQFWKIPICYAYINIFFNI